MEDLTILRRSDLEQLISDAVRKATEAKKPERKRVLSIDEAVAYLNGCGYSIAKSTVYKLTSAGHEAIPFYRLGERKLAFKADELDEWLEEQLERRPNRVNENVRASALKKMA